MKALGIDVGSLTTKAVVLDDGDILAYSLISSTDEADLSAREALNSVLKQTGFSFEDNLYIVTTGVGGKSASFARQSKAITTCLARGIHYLLPSVRMLIDLGAESGTVLKLNERGRVNDSASHDKCAAGTGVFLQQMAKLMQIPLEEISQLSLRAESKADITNTCAVFAESEVISHVHRDPPTPMEDIAAGIYYSVVTRTMSLCKRLGVSKDVAVVGGVALHEGLISIVSEEFGFEVLVPDNPQIVAALGAAVIARENIEKGA